MLIALPRKSDAHVRKILEKLESQTHYSVQSRNIFTEKQEMQLDLLRNIAQATQNISGQQQGGSRVLTGPVSPHPLPPVKEISKGRTTLIELKSKEDLDFPTSSREITNKTKKSPYTPLVCFDDCTCRCHCRSCIRSPRRLSMYIGDLFLGFSSLPPELQSIEPCNQQTCRRSKSSKIDVNFFLPTWLTLNSVRFNLAFKMSRVPMSVSLQTRNTIPYDSPIHHAIQSGNIDDVKDILCSGKASLNDIDPYGLGLLYVSRSMPSR